MLAVKARPKVQASPAPRQRLSNQISSNVDHRSIDRRPRNSSRSQQRRRQRERTREQQFRVQSINYDVPYPHENKERPRRVRKVYRRKKVLRKWVFPALFLVPLGMIWVEYYIGKLIDLEDIRDVYQDQLVDPWDLLEQDLNASRIRERGSISSLPKLAYAPRTQCPPGQRRMINVHNPVSPSGGRRRIPMVVHQQSKTRCLTMKVDAATTKWAMKRWSYYMHDEDSRSRLFDEYCGGAMPACEFPLLSQIVGKCFYNQTDTQNRHRYYSLKTELWKFLTLWIFGGVYADIDFLPHKFSPITISPSDDAYLVIDSDTKMLSTKLMAVSPRHPLMYYAVQQMLLSILMEDSSSSLVNTGGYETGISGSSILSAAFRMFQEGDKVRGQSTNFSPGTFHGAMSRTIRLVSTGGLNTKVQADMDGKKAHDLVVSIFQSENAKEDEFQKMGMTAEESKEWGGDDAKRSSTGEILEEGESNLDGVVGVVTPPPPPRLSCRQKLYHL